MRSRGLIGLAVLSCLGLLVLLVLSINSQAATITVPDDHPHIHDAITAADPGDTIYVKAGTYNESVYLYKSLNLIGASETNTTLYCNDTFPQLSAIYADIVGSINISGFTITGTQSGSGVELSNIADIIIENCSFIDNGDGILAYVVNNLTIRDCYFKNSSAGFSTSHIGLEKVENVLIETNYFDATPGYSILFSDIFAFPFTTFSYNATVQYNEFNSTGAIALHNVNETVIKYNNFTNILYDAVGIYGFYNTVPITGTNISYNIFENCSTSEMLINYPIGNIWIGFANYINITRNYFYNSTGYPGDLGNASSIVFETYAGNTSIWYNNFINNEVHIIVYDPILTVMDNVSFDNNAYGNYWDNYTGIDDDGNGIGDTPFFVCSLNGVILFYDNYPLMDPMTRVCEEPEPEPEEPESGVFDDVMDITVAVMLFIIMFLVIRVVILTIMHQGSKIGGK